MLVYPVSGGTVKVLMNMITLTLAASQGLSLWLRSKTTVVTQTMTGPSPGVTPPVLMSDGLPVTCQLAQVSRLGRWMGIHTLI